MPEDLDSALRASVQDVLPEVAEGANGHRWHWRPDGRGQWSSPAPRRLAAAASMPVGPLAARLAAALSAGLTERLGAAAGRAVGVGDDGFLVVTPGVEDCAAAVTAVLAAGPAYGRPARPVSALVVDPAVPQRRTPDNLPFVVMWAHARCCVAVDRASTDGTPAPATSSLTQRVLVILLADVPRAVAAAGDDPAAVVRRLHEVAAVTHQWLDESDTHALEPGRLVLVNAARQVLAAGLDVLGLPAPSRL